MTNKQMFEACLLAAPNFRLGVEYPVLGRSLVWHGTPVGSLTELSAGIDFAEDSPFEPRFTFLLTQATIMLQQAVG